MTNTASDETKPEQPAAEAEAPPAPKMFPNTGMTQEQLEAFLASWLDDVFAYHAPTPDQVELYDAIRKAGRELARVIIVSTPACADRAAALRKVREAVMTSNAAIALNGRG
jgi:hypothetical protein